MHGSCCCSLLGVPAAKQLIELTPSCQAADDSQLAADDSHLVVTPTCQAADCPDSQLPSSQAADLWPFEVGVSGFGTLISSATSNSLSR